jgi:hypothetical protein
MQSLKVIAAELLPIKVAALTTMTRSCLLQLLLPSQCVWLLHTPHQLHHLQLARSRYLRLCAGRMGTLLLLQGFMS